MNLSSKLNEIRPRSKKPLAPSQKIFRLCAIAVLGLSLGIIAKFTDEHTDIVGEIGSGIAIWVLFGTLIAIYSRSAVSASISVFVFFVFMLISYYIYTYLLFGFFPARYVSIWAFLTILSIFGSFLLWFSHSEGWIPAIIASLPITFLIIAGIPFFYTLNILYAFSLASAVLLFILIPPTIKQKLKTAIFVVAGSVIFAIIAFILNKLYSNIN